MLMIFLDVGSIFFGHIKTNFLSYNTLYFEISNLFTNRNWMNASLINYCRFKYNQLVASATIISRLDSS